ncbi:efflux RND transporter periplasmic adaptor subunit [Peptoniphilus raoultii]|uniref:efflux RND transporter periplasmic adaptor subunit n=1 Tax=Peptoniphilus raoultii TaxID=1776387 RepID=UPI0008D927AC|nr:efflux RND transporter periplasmic adaptor subunit [Peptoniphilus raoultii]
MEKIKKIFKKIKDFLLSHKIILIVLGLILLLILAKIIGGLFFKKDYEEISQNQIVTLTKGEVINSVNENGKVAPNTSNEIYAEKQLPVKEILVKVGDKVEEGQVLARLDGDSLEEEIEKAKAQKSASGKTVAASINSAKKRLAEAQENRKNGTNPTIVSAQTALQSSKDAYNAAKKAYEDYKSSIDLGYNPEIVGEKNSRENLAYQEESGNLKFRQLQSDYNDNIVKASENRKLAREKEIEKNRIQNEIDNLNRILTEIGIKQGQLQADLEGSKSVKKLSTGEKENSSPKTESIIVSGDSSQIEETTRKINNLTREQTEINIKIKNLTDELSKVSGDKEKYTSEADALDKEIESQRKNLDLSKIDIDKARDDLKADADKSIKASKAREDQLKTLEQNMIIAENSYKAAEISLKSAEASVDNEISMLRDALTSANASSNNIEDVQIKFLEEELEKTNIKALNAGTVTEVLGKEGQVPQGPVVKIESVSELKIESKVKEYNIKEVKVGTKVIITTEALPGEEFQGKVTFINPSPEENNDPSSKEVYYKTSIEISKEDSQKLNTGMNLRVKYILSQEKNTFSVPSTAVFERDGKKYVLALKEKQKGIFESQKLEVETGLENDFEIAIKGSKLKEKMMILSTSEGYGEGQKFSIAVEDKMQSGPSNKENAGEGSN